MHHLLTAKTASLLSFITTRIPITRISSNTMVHHTNSRVLEAATTTIEVEANINNEGIMTEDFRALVPTIIKTITMLIEAVVVSTIINGRAQLEVDHKYKTSKAATQIPSRHHLHPHTLHHTTSAKRPVMRTYRHSQKIHKKTKCLLHQVLCKTTRVILSQTLDRRSAFNSSPSNLKRLQLSHLQI
jgi:hypothetical protein